MKLWLVLYVGSQIGGTWGPLPYGVEECRDRAKVYQAILVEARTNPAKVAKLKAEGRWDDIQKTFLKCERNDIRPKITLIR